MNIVVGCVKRWFDNKIYISLDDLVLYLYDHYSSGRYGKHVETKFLIDQLNEFKKRVSERK